MRVVVQSGITRSAGGLFYAVSALCRELDAAGMELRVMGAARSGFPEEDRAVWGAVPVESYRAVGPLNSVIGLRKKLAHSGADLIHQHGLWLDDQWAALAWQKKTGNPVVISPHGMLDPWALQNSAWKKKVVEVLFAKSSLQKATCIHALCQAEAEAIRAYGLTNPIALIPNAVDLPEIDQKQPTSESKKTLLFLGRIHPKKGLNELVEAWSHPPGRWRENWTLVVAGWDDGGHLRGIQSRVAELGLGSSITFVGPRFGKEKDRLLRRADALILPSHSEGLPVTVLEAWAYRLPVVMTPFCNLPEGFKEGAALSIDTAPESIATGLDQLARMPDAERLLMGMRGRRLVEDRFVWSRVAREMAEVYAWCAGRGKEPECLWKP